MTEDDFCEAIAALTGRMAMLETLNAHMLANMCVQFDQPEALAAHILDGVESRLLAAQQATPESERQAVDTARASYRELSRAMLQMVTRIAEPHGNG